MEKNIHLIKTDKASRLYENTGTLILDKSSEVSKDGISINQHLYITNSEEINDGDFVYSTNEDYNIQKVPKNSVKAYRDCGHYKKIILTTDADLIAGGVHSIDDTFLELFIKNPSCEFVKTFKFADSVTTYAYKIIIPQEKIKQTDEKGNPLTFWGGLKKHKKESIEEEAESFAKGRVELDPIYANGLYYGFVQCGISKWFEAEKIKAQMQVLDWIQEEEVEPHLIRIKLEQQLKETK
jgi:hypothetical protein